MSTDQNKAIARRFYKAFEGNVAILDEVLADDFVAHAPADPGAHEAEAQDRQRLQQEIVRMNGVFPDISFTIHDSIAEGDKVAVRWTATGVHQGEMMGVPPTGKQVTISGMNILRIAAGKIAEDWVLWDAANLMQQLGMGPGGPGGAKE